MILIVAKLLINSCTLRIKLTLGAGFHRLFQIWTGFKYYQACVFLSKETVYYILCLSLAGTF